jgi:hypothetical protein
MILINMISNKNHKNKLNNNKMIFLNKLLLKINKNIIDLLVHLLIKLNKVKENKKYKNKL